MDIPGSRGTGGGIGTGRGSRAAAQHGGDARHQGIVHLLRADHVNVRIDPAGGQYLALAGNDFATRSDDDVHAGLGVRVTGLADTADASVFDTDIGLDDAPVIDDQRVGDDHVGRIRGAPLALSHSVTDHLAAAEFDFVAVDGAVVLDAYPQL